MVKTRWNLGVSILLIALLLIMALTKPIGPALWILGVLAFILCCVVMVLDLGLFSEKKEQTFKIKVSQPIKIIDCTKDTDKFRPTIIMTGEYVLVRRLNPWGFSGDYLFIVDTTLGESEIFWKEHKAVEFLA